MNPAIRRLLIALGVLHSLVLAGATGYWLLGHGRWRFDECVYMTVITLSTVGFGELSRMNEVPGARLLTLTLIVSGVGALAYVQGNLTALLVEGALGQAFRRNRMRKAIEARGEGDIGERAKTQYRHFAGKFSHLAYHDWFFKLSPTVSARDFGCFSTLYRVG